MAQQRERSMIIIGLNLSGYKIKKNPGHNNRDFS